MTASDKPYKFPTPLALQAELRARQLFQVTKEVIKTHEKVENKLRSQLDGLEHNVASGNISPVNAEGCDHTVASENIGVVAARHAVKAQWPEAEIVYEGRGRDHFDVVAVEPRGGIHIIEAKGSPLKDPTKTSRQVGPEERANQCTPPYVQKIATLMAKSRQGRLPGNKWTAAQVGKAVLDHPDRVDSWTVSVPGERTPMKELRAEVNRREAVSPGYLDAEFFGQKRRVPPKPNEQTNNFPNIELKSEFKNLAKELHEGQSAERREQIQSDQRNASRPNKRHPRMSP